MIQEKEIELIIGNSGRNFSGGTSITIQLLQYQNNLMKLAILGSSYMPKNYKTLTYLEFLLLTRKKLSNGKPRVFYTRRNDEMIQGLIAKYFFNSKIKIIFSSSAQRIHTKFTKWLISKMDSIVTTSNIAGSYLVKKPNIVIPHGIDTKRYVPVDNKEGVWNNLGFSGTFGIGIFGRVRYSKGVDILIDAAIKVLPENKSATIIICGETQTEDQHYKNKMLKKIKEANLQDRVLFLGKRPFEELPKLFQGVSVVAALSRNEGYGLTPLEGMSSGAAVLTSSAGVWKELVRDGVDGFVVDNDNVEQTADKLKFLIENRNMTKNMGENAAKYIHQKFSVKDEAEKIIGHIKEIQDA